MILHFSCSLANQSEPVQTFQKPLHFDTGYIEFVIIIPNDFADMTREAKKGSYLPGEMVVWIPRSESGWN